MGKLRAIGGTLATLKPTLGTLAAAQGAPRKRGRAGDEQRMRRLEAHGVQCSRCGCLGVWKQAEASDILPLLVVDHVVPLAHGGEDVDRNTRVVCEPCHRLLTAEQFGRCRG